jgi:hypothetical protein
VQDAEAYQRLIDIAARTSTEEGIRQRLEDLRRGWADLVARALGKAARSIWVDR